MVNLTELSDYTRYLIYHPDRMDTGRTLWFVRDVADVDALEGNAVTCMGPDGFAKCREFFSAFPSVFIAVTDTDVPTAAEIAEDLAGCCPDISIMTPKPGVFGKCKFVREVLQTGGEKRVDHLILGAVERPVEGLLNLADVRRENLANVPYTLSTIGEINKKMRGFYAGELSIWTGVAGSGKSTYIGQELIEAVNQGFPVCAYSGELLDWEFKDWIVQQIAGPDYVTPILDPLSGMTLFEVDKEVAERIDRWLNGKFYLCDGKTAGADEEDTIIKLFEYAVRRYGCCVFLADNLLTVQLSKKEDDYYRNQGAFVSRLKSFAKKNEVHVHLVAHPRKGEAKDLDDVGGSGDIIKLADNVFCLKRLTEEQAQQEGYTAMLNVWKNRKHGQRGLKIALDFDERSRRFYRPGTTPDEKRYGW